MNPYSDVDLLTQARVTRQALCMFIFHGTTCTFCSPYIETLLRGTVPS